MGGMTLREELEGFIRSIFVQSSDLGAKKELVGAAGAQPLSQVSCRGGGRVSRAGGSGVPTHLLSQPVVPVGSGGEERSWRVLSPLSSL